MDVTGTTSRARTTVPSGTAAQPTARPADTTPTTTGGAVALRADTVQISGPAAPDPTRTWRTPATSDTITLDRP